MLEMETELLLAAGVKAYDLTPEIIYDLAGKIIHDPFVTILAQKEIVRGVMESGTRAKVIRNMPETERAALRDRIGAGVANT